MEFTMAKTSAEQLAEAIQLQAQEDDDLDTDAVEPDENEPESDDKRESDDSDKSDHDEVDEDELPSGVKAILKKNRDRVREVEKELRQLKRGNKVESENSEKAEMFRGLLVKSAARAALSEAGLQGNADRFVRMLDMGAIEVDDSGEIDGLDEQIEDIKADFPDLFEVKEPPRRRRSPGDGAPRTVTPRQKTSAEVLAERLTK